MLLFIFERTFWRSAALSTARQPDPRVSQRPPAAPQAAHRSPLPTHPKASIFPHPGGLLRKAGRSPSDRPFVFLASGAAQSSTECRQGRSLGPSTGRKLPVTQFEIFENRLSQKKKCNKIRVWSIRDMRFCKLRASLSVLK